MLLRFSRCNAQDPCNMHPHCLGATAVEWISFSTKKDSNTGGHLKVAKPRTFRVPSCFMSSFTPLRSGKGHTRLTRWRATLCGMVGESSTSHADDQHPLSLSFWNTEKPMRCYEKSRTNMKNSPTIMRIYHQPSTIPLLWSYLLALDHPFNGKIKGSSSPWLSKQYHLRGRGWRSIQMFHGFPHGFPKMFRQILSQCWENHGQCQTNHGTYGGNIQNYRPKYVSSKKIPRFSQQTRIVPLPQFSNPLPWRESGWSTRLRTPHSGNPATNSSCIYIYLMAKKITHEHP